MSRPIKNPKFVPKVCEFCKKEFQVKYQKRNIQRYCGKVCANADPATKLKIVTGQNQAYAEKYGGVHPMQTESTLSNFKKSMKKKYGVESALKLSRFIDKATNTKIEKYNDAGYNNVEKRKQTCLVKYGVDNFRKSSEYGLKYERTCLSRYGEIHSSKSPEYKLAHKKLMFEKFLKNPRFENFVPKFSIDDYNGVTQNFNEKYPFQCKRCNEVELHSIDSGKGPRCYKCDKQFSTFQSEIQEFIKSLNPEEVVTFNDRTVIYPKELDIYLPGKKLAIECDSLCFHSERFGLKNKLYHLNKTKHCVLNGIRLIHIWDSEWRLKKEIIKSILGSFLNAKIEKIHARECEVRELKKSECSEFLSKNHLQGNDHSSIKLGLFFKNELVSVMTFCKSRFNKNVEWELSRYCNKLDTRVSGGASKLFSHFLRSHSPSSIISYSDRRFFDGEVYATLGFSFVDNTEPSYHYIIDNYVTTTNRLSWQKHLLKNKLENFDEKLTEWENMMNHGFDRIWDCGHSKWIYST